MGEIFVVHVQLAGVQPAVWRRLEIRTSASFWDLHCAIQDVMPWEDRHLHEFRFPTGDVDMQIGIVDPGMAPELEFLASWESFLKDGKAS